MKKIILLIWIMILFIGCEGLQQKPQIRIESVICRVQDNSNYSHWCEYECGNNIIEEAMKCHQKEEY